MTRTVQQLFDLSDKTALVTGGSSGLGLQMAHALGEAGARIMLAARNADELEQACAELQSAGIDARWMVADCAKESDLHHLTQETLQRMGDVDILLNNAGATCGGYATLSQVIANKSMIPRRSGRIINIACNTARGAVINFTQALAAEWGQHNITVNALCPGDDGDLRGACVLLASDAGKHITGQWLAVGGGVSVATGSEQGGVQI